MVYFTSFCRLPRVNEFSKQKKTPLKPSPTVRLRKPFLCFLSIKETDAFSSFWKLTSLDVCPIRGRLSAEVLRLSNDKITTWTLTIHLRFVSNAKQPSQSIPTIHSFIRTYAQQMSLNWTQIDYSSLRPIPLPNETLSESFSGIDLELRLPVSLMGPKRTARSLGQIHLSNQRIIFVSSTTGSSPPDAPPSTPPASDTLGPGSGSAAKESSSDAAGLPVFLKAGVDYVSSFLPVHQPLNISTTDPQISTISIPLVQLLDRKFNQNLFDSNTVYISFRPTPDGGFPSSRQGVDSIGINLAFKEGRAWELWKSLENCLKCAHADGLERRRQRQYGESLPAYSGPA